MNAIVSGGLGAAVLLNGTEAQWLDDRNARVVPCGPREVRRLTLGNSDAVFLQGVTEVVTRNILRLSTNLYAALTQLSIASSADSTDEDKQVSLASLENLLAEAEVEDALCNVAYSKVPYDLNAVLSVAREERLSRCVALLQDLSAASGAIARVCEAWDSTARSDDEAYGRRVRAWAVRSGLFREVVNAVRDGRPTPSTDELFGLRRSYSRYDASIDLPSVTPFFERWLGDLQKAFHAAVDEWKQRIRARLDALREQIPFARASVQLFEGADRILLVGSGFVEATAERGFLQPIPYDPLIARVVSARRRVFVPDTQADQDWTRKPATGDIASWLGAPIIYDDRWTIGLLTLDFTQRLGAFDAFDPALKAFCDEIADLLWLAGPLHQKGRAEQAVQIAHRVINTVSANLEYQHVLETIAKEVALNLECSHCTIFLLEGSGPARELVAMHTFGVGADAPKVRFPVKASLVGYVFDRGEPLLVPDASRHSAFIVGRNAAAVARSMLLAPIRVGDQKIGVICADQDKIGWFRRSDLNLLETLAQQAGLAIQRSHSVSLLGSIAHNMLSASSVESILNEVLRSAIKITNATTGVIYLVDSKKDPIDITLTVPFDDFPHPDPRLHEESGITNTVVKTGKLVEIADLRSDPRVNRELLSDLESLIALPLTIEGDVIGVLFVDDEDPHVFTQVEKELLTILASLSAIAIRNTNEMQRHKELQSQLFALEEQRATPSEKVGVVLAFAARGVCKILRDHKVSCIAQIWAQGASRSEFAGPLAGALSTIELPPRSSPFFEPCFDADLSALPLRFPNPLEALRKLGVKSLTVIPFSEDDGDTFGSLLICGERRIEFSDDERKAIVLFASTAALTIRRARAYEEQARAYEEQQRQLAAAVDAVAPWGPD